MLLILRTVFLIKQVCQKISLQNFIFLLDDLGRVRFAGSGPATQEEISNLIQFTKELISLQKKNGKRPGKKNKKR